MQQLRIKSKSTLKIQSEYFPFPLFTQIQQISQKMNQDTKSKDQTMNQENHRNQKKKPKIEF